jgi:hypothetical protein
MDPNWRRRWYGSWIGSSGERRSRRIAVALLPLLLLPALALPKGGWAHSGTFNAISLDEDPRLKAAVIRAAQRFLRTRQQPVSFDSINGKIAVNFDQERKRVVLVDYLPFGTTGRVLVSGFKDEGRKSSGEAPRITPEAAQRLAEPILRRVPREKQRELVFDGVTQFGGMHHVRWVRQVQGILVMGNEDLSVGVDHVSGAVVYWDLGIFDFPAAMIETSPRIGPVEAARRATEAASVEVGEAMRLAEDFKPVLLIYSRGLRWAVRLTNGKPGTANASQYVLVPAREGEVIFRGPRDPELESLPRSYVEGFVATKP